MSRSRSNSVIEYIDETHTYLINGVIVPSVSQLLKRVFPDKYKDVPRAILERKAEYGTIVHEAIERLENASKMPPMNIFQELALIQYKKLKERNGFAVVDQEKIVHFQDRFCGRYDMTIKLDDRLCLADIKTTAKLDHKYLSYQLSLYELAYEWTFNTDPFPFARFYCLWLPKNELGQFVEIERVDRERLLKDFGF